MGHFGEQKRQPLSITLASFGFRRGLPQNADLVFDVRFLPNPHYDADLQPLTGLDTPVREFVESQPATKAFLEHIEGMLAFLLPEYAAEGKDLRHGGFRMHRRPASIGGDGVHGERDVEQSRILSDGHAHRPRRRDARRPAMSDQPPCGAAVGAVIVTHGGLATELLAATERIVGPTDAIRAVSIDWDEPVEEARRLVQEAIESLDCANGVLIFTDMFGGTPTNVCLSFLETGRVEILAGVNLPMLVKMTNLQGSEGNLAEITELVRDRGQNSLCVASEILSAKERL